MSKSNIEHLNSLMWRQLSDSFFFRDFVYSETAAAMGINNVPADVELAVEAGSQLCQNVLEPIQNAWGRIHVRSAFRSEAVNATGNELQASCASNESNYAGHIWDRRDSAGFMGATACIVIPRYLSHFEATKDWTSIAWWVYEHIPAYSSMYFFPKLCAFNINWYEDQTRPKNINSYATDPNTGHKKAILKDGRVSDFYEKVPATERYAACTSILSGM